MVLAFADCGYVGIYITAFGDHEDSGPASPVA
jgi:hypothetical protein